MIKVEMDGIAYIFETVDHLKMSLNTGYNKEMNMLRGAVLVYSKKTNKFLKCRYDVEELVEAFINKQERD